MFDKTLDVLYAGLAPSTGHPSRFDGCLRDVAINAVTLPIDEKGKVSSSGSSPEHDSIILCVYAAFEMKTVRYYSICGFLTTRLKAV